MSQHFSGNHCCLDHFNKRCRTKHRWDLVNKERKFAASPPNTMPCLSVAILCLFIYRIAVTVSHVWVDLTKPLAKGNTSALEQDVICVLRTVHITEPPLLQLSLPSNGLGCCPVLLGFLGERGGGDDTGVYRHEQQPQLQGTACETQGY